MFIHKSEHLILSEDTKEYQVCFLVSIMHIIELGKLYIVETATKAR